MPIVGADENLAFAINVFTNADVQLKKASAALDGFVRQADQKVGAAERIFSRLGRSIAFTTRAVNALAGRWIAMATTIGGTFAIFRSVSDAQRFGITIAEIGSIFEGTAAQLEAVESKIFEFSEQLGLNESIVGKGFYEIISADILDAAEAMVVLTGSTKLATIGLADAAQTIDLVTSIIKAYGLEVTETGRITDSLFQTVITGKTTIPELAHSLGQVLPIAATLGIRLNEVGAALATITLGGIETNTAVIQLRQAFNQMLKPSAEASTLLAQYGIDLSQARIKSVGFAGVLTDLREKLGNNAAAYARIFGNIRALIPILALTGDRYEQFNKVLAKNDASLGLVEERLATFLQNPFKRIQVFFNEIRQRLLLVGKTFILEFNRVIDDRGGADAVLDRIGVALGSLEGIATAVANAFGRGIDQLTIFITKLGGLEKAEVFFLSLGRLIGATGELIAHALFAGLQIAVNAALELAKLFQRIVRDGKLLANSIAESLSNLPGIDLAIPFPDLSPLEQFQERIGDVDTALFTLGRNLREAEASLQKAVASGARDIIVQRNEERVAAIQEAIAAQKELRGTLLEQRETLGIDSTGTKALKDASEALGMFASGSKDVLKSWLEARRELLDILEGIMPAGGPAAVEVDLELRIDPTKAERQAREAAIKFRDELQVEVNEIAGTLQILTGLELPPIDIGTPLFPAVEQIRQQMRDLFADETGLVLTVDIDAQEFDNIVARFDQLTQIQGELLQQVNANSFAARAEVDSLRQSFRVRKQLFDLSLLEIGITAEKRRELLDLLDVAEIAARQAAIGFKDFPQFFTKLAGDAEIPWEVTVAGIRKSREEAEDLLALAVEIGSVTEDQAVRIGEAIRTHIGEQLRKLQKDVVGKQLEKLRNDPAFTRGSTLERFQQQIRDAAAAAARAQTDLNEITAEGTVEAERLGDAYEETFARMLRGGDAFAGGFLARLEDIQRELGDLVAAGARFADDLTGAFRQGFSTGITAALLDEDGALESAKEALARGLAQALSNAISDQLTALATTGIKVVGEALFGGLGGIAESVTEVSAEERITVAALQAITEVDAATVGAVGTIQGAFVGAADGFLTVIGAPATLLEQAAALQIEAARALLASTGVQVPAGAAVAGAEAVVPGAVATGAEVGADAAAETAALEGASLAAFTPAATALQGAGVVMDTAATGMATAAPSLLAAGASGEAAGIALGVAAQALSAAAASLTGSGAAGTVAGAAKMFGGYTQGPLIQGFALGTQTIPKRLTDISAGGVKTQEILTRVREGGQNEAVVPLPGNGREIPVELRNPEALSRGSGPAVVVHQEAHLTLNVTSDDRSFATRVIAQMPIVEKALAATLSRGGNRALEDGVRRAARGA